MGTSRLPGLAGARRVVDQEGFDLSPVSKARTGAPGLGQFGINDRLRREAVHTERWQP